MYIACQEVARLLLGEGADKEKAEKNGATPLLFVTCVRPRGGGQDVVGRGSRQGEDEQIWQHPTAKSVPS